MTNFYARSYCNFVGERFENETKILRASAQLHDVPLVFLGQGETNYNHYKKIIAYHNECIRIQTLDPHGICLFVDATDTMFLMSPAKMVEKFHDIRCSILLSAEQNYSWQDFQFKDYYDRRHRDTPYKYLNSGCIMGKVAPLQHFFQNIIEYFVPEDHYHRLIVKADDQCAIGTYIALNKSLGHEIQLDTHCRVFYNPVNEWDELCLHLTKTQSWSHIPFHSLSIQPSVLHVCPKWKFKHVYELFFECMKNNPIHEQKTTYDGASTGTFSVFKHGLYISLVIILLIIFTTVFIRHSSMMSNRTRK